MSEREEILATSLSERWQAGSIGDLALINQSSLSENESPEREIEYFDISSASETTPAPVRMKFKDAPSRARRLAEEGDVIYSCVRPLLRRIFFTNGAKNAVYSTGYAVLHPKQGNDARFIKHTLVSNLIEKEIYARLTGSGYPAISTTDLSAIPVLIPPYPEQRSIAEILSTWDETLERMSRQIERKIEVFASLRGSLVAGRRRLFGRNGAWRPTSLSTLLEPVKRAVPRPTEPYQALSIRSHGKGTFQRFVDRPETVDMDTLYRVGGRDLIVNITFAWEGAVALAKPKDEGCLVSHRFPTFVIDEELIDRDFLGYAINDKRFFHYLGIVSPGGAGRNRVLNQRDFLEIKISVPGLAEQHAIAELLLDAEYEIAALKAEQVVLAKQRDALTTELLTGRLRVPLAEAAS